VTGPAQLVEGDGELVLGFVGNGIRHFFGRKRRQLEEPAQDALAGDIGADLGPLEVAHAREKVAERLINHFRARQIDVGIRERRPMREKLGSSNF
jgi:hypothetical protein